jgi:ribosomal protein S18 acetylase RimI-like enzyme
LEAVFLLDTQAFGDDRRFFLRRRLAQHPQLCRVMEEQGRINGFIMGRRGPGFFTAGPWVSTSSAGQAAALLHSLTFESGEQAIEVGVLDANSAAVQLLRSLGFVERPDSPWRMLRGEDGTPGLSSLAYAIGSAAKG